MNEELPGIKIRPMEADEITRLGEIDRTEHITRDYKYENGGLREVEVDFKVPPLHAEGEEDHSINRKINAWRPYLEKDGGLMFGAFDGDLLVGLVILRPRLTRDMAELAVLYISYGYRGKGIGTRLTEKVCNLATGMGASSIYVSSTPTKTTVDFYRRRGFTLAKKLNKEVYEREPDDIHMIKELR